MKFLGSFVTAVSGSLGGITAATNRGGQYLRARLIPTDPSSPTQASTRAIFGSVSASWLADLTATERTQWNLYAANTPMTDSLGQSFLLSGHQQFVRSNVHALVSGGSLFTTGPITFGLGATPLLSAWAPLETSATVACSNIPAGGTITGFPGRPQNPSVGFFRGPWKFGASSGASPLAVTQPFPAGVGQNQWCLVRTQDTEGRLSAAAQIGPSIVVVDP